MSLRPKLRLLGILSLVVPASALADTVRLRSGDVVEGEVKDMGDRIEVAAKDGPLSIRWRDVEVVLKDKSALDVYGAKRAAIAKGDAKSLYALALWAERAGLPEQRRECLEAVVAADPEHAAAREALSQQKSDGKWLSGAALLAAKGFVGKDGAWVLKEEAEAMARRAEAAKGFLPPEKRAEELLKKAGEGNEAARKFALDALRGLDPDDVRRPALRALRRGEPAAREAAARALGKSRDVDVLRPLIAAAILDRSATVRVAAVDSLKEIGDADVVRPIAKAMWSEIPEVRMNAAEALGSIGGGVSVEWVLRRVMSTGGPGGRNHIFAGTQESYISDFDVEIAQASQIGDPIIGVIRDGVMLDYRVLSVREEWTDVERRVYYTALARATGRDYGQDPVAWKKWWDSEGRTAMASSKSDAK
jgi:HEAT repeat protein